MSEILDLTRKLVSIDSSNPGAYENAVGDYIAAWLTDAGAVVERDELAARPGRYNLVAKIPGAIDDPGLVYIAHMDTVPFHPEAWTHEPLSGEIVGDDMYGCGTADMKGGVAAYMLAFRHILQMKKPLKRSFTLILTCDEEDEMHGGEQAVLSGRVTKKSWILATEPSGGDIQMAHKGKTWFRIHIKGKSAHSSVPWTGIDAIGAAAEILSGLRRRIAALPVDPEMGPTTITLGEIRGGTNINIVADECYFTVDMRLAPPVTSDMSVEIMNEAIEEGLAKVPGATCDCKITAKRPYIQRNPDSAMLAEVKACYRDVFGAEAPESICGAYADTTVIAGMTGNKDAMLFARMNASTVHKPDEHASCKALEETAAFVEKLAEQILL